MVVDEKVLADTALYIMLHLTPSVDKCTLLFR